MTEDERPPLWLPPISLLAVVFITWLLSYPPKALSPHALVPFYVTGQALCVIILLRAFCYWPPMLRWVRSMPIPHRLIFTVLIASMIIGHFTLTNRYHYPYISWFIFPSVREDDPVTCDEFIATTASGKKVRLLAEQIFPSIVQAYPPDDPIHYTPEKMDLFIRAMARSYSARHAADPVRSVDLVVMSVQLHPPASESRNEPSCQLLKRYDFSSGQ